MSVLLSRRLAPPEYMPDTNAVLRSDIRSPRLPLDVMAVSAPGLRRQWTSTRASRERAKVMELFRRFYEHPTLFFVFFMNRIFST